MQQPLPPPPPQQQQQRAGFPAHSSGQGGGTQQQPLWHLPPWLCVEQLLKVQAPLLLPDPPLTVSGTSLAVRLHLQHVAGRRGGRKPPSQQTLLGMLWRQGLARPNSTQQWAGLHQLRGDGSVVVTVLDTPAAQAAARDTVAAGHVVIDQGGAALTVPVSWAPTAKPPGCTVVTVHQLPPQYARKGVGTALLEAAAQRGTVVAEFLGGSALVGDAQLSCPAADTVVLWVEPPPEDLLLTRLPSSFEPGVPGWPTVHIEVASRPSLAPQSWQPLNQLLQRQLQAALERITAAVGAAAGAAAGGQPEQQQQEPNPQQQEAQPLPPSPPPPPAPPQPLQQQQQQRQAPGGRQPLGLSAGQQTWATPPQQQQQQRTQQRRPAVAPPSAQQQQQQQQQQRDAASDMELDAEPEPATRPRRQQGGAAHLPADPFDTQHSRTHWVQLQVEDMLDMAVTLADDEGDGPDRCLPQQRRQQLQQAFCERFSSALQQEASPSEAEVRSWLRGQLGIQRLSYGSDSGADTSDEDMADVPDGAAQDQQQREHSSAQQSHQQRRRGKQTQPPPSQPSRRSERSTAGRMSAGYASMWGPGQQHSNAAGRQQREGRKGAGLAHPANTAGTPPLTPAATHPAPRARRRAAGLQ